MPEDYIYHGRIDPLHIGFTFASSPRLANEAILRHDCDPPAAHLLGRALNASLLLLPRIGVQESLNLHWSYKGAVRDVLIDLRGDGRIRGMINPSHLSERAETQQEIYGEESGQLQVVTSLGGRVLSSGTASCDLQNVTGDLGYYFSVSEQVETECNVMIDFTHNPEQPVALCQGLLIQALPECDLEQFDRIRRRLHQEAARTHLASPSRADGLFEEILNDITAPEEVDTHITLESAPSPRWFCTCNEEKIHTTLRMLPAEDREDLIQKAEPIVVRCDFCNRAFRFTPREAQVVWGQTPPG